MILHRYVNQGGGINYSGGAMVPCRRAPPPATTSCTMPPRIRRWPTLAVVVSAQFMFVVDAFVANVSLPSIAGDLHATGGELQAVIAAYQMAYATLVITGGRLGDIFGRRPAFITGVIAFTIASLWCGLSRSGMELILARLVQGATAALMVPQVLATIHVLFPESTARAKAFAIFGIALGLGAAAGFALGGWLVTINPIGLGWRAVFLVNLPVGAAIALGAAVLMPRIRPAPGMRLDLPGTFLLFIALGALIGPVMAGRDLGWPIWLLPIIAAGALLLPVFLARQRATARRGGLPLIEPALLSDRPFLRGLGAVSALQFGNLSFYLILTLYLQDRIGLSPLQAGTTAVPLALAFSLASRLAGHVVSRYGTRVMIAGTAFQFAGIVAFVGLTHWVQHPAPLVLATLLSVFGFGQGLVMAPLSGMVLATVAPTHAGAGAGVLNTTQQAAGTVGVSVVGAAWFQYGPPAAMALLLLSIIATAAGLHAMQRSTLQRPQPQR